MPDEPTPDPITEEPDVTVIDRATFDEAFARIETRMATMAASLEAPALPGLADTITPLEWFHAEVQRRFADNAAPRRRLETRWDQVLENLETRHGDVLADITGTLEGTDDLSGVVVEQFIASQLVNVLDDRRPFFASLGSFPMPRSGTASIPVVTQHTLVDDRTGQKDPVNSRKMIVVKRSFEAEWLDGAVDIAIELIASAELPVLAMVWDDLLAMYAVKTEAKATSIVEAGGHGFNYTGAALPTDTYANFAEAVATQAIEVREGSGRPATRLAVTKPQWPKLVAMIDGSDRRQFATRGAQNADASVTFTAESFELPGGITVFYSPGITQAMLYNDASLRGADGGPIRVEATNVELMGRDLGILGRSMTVPRIPAGVVVFGDDPGSE